MKFQYSGDDDSPKAITAFGMRFQHRGAYIEVEDPFVIAKLQGNSQFREKGAEPEKVVKKVKKAKKGTEATE